MNLAAVSFAFIGKITKANEFFVQDSLDKLIPYVNLLFLGQKFAIGAKDISNEETL